MFLVSVPGQVAETIEGLEGGAGVADVFVGASNTIDVHNSVPFEPFESRSPVVTWTTRQPSAS